MTRLEMIKLNICVFCMTEVNIHVCANCDEYDGIVTPEEFESQYGYDYYAE